MVYGLNFMNSLITTIIRRPYVFAFLAAYLVLAWRLWGWRRTLFWLLSGYLIAWASEFSSIHNGFPYGEYHYIYENMPGELMIAGVPFFDSLSYPFLIFAGYTTALFILRPFAPGLGDSGAQGLRGSGATVIFLGALLTMMLDVIIDPVAKLGGQWFLGEIYYYASPGHYFGVPLSNFAGWFLVPFAVICFNMVAWRTFPNSLKPAPGHLGTWAPGSKQAQGLMWLYPTFYTGIALFNIAVSFWIGALNLGLCSSGILLVIVAIITVHASQIRNPKL